MQLDENAGVKKKEGILCFFWSTQTYTHAHLLVLFAIDQPAWMYVCTELSFYCYSFIATKGVYSSPVVWLKC